jgi:hypothetical protein
MDIKISVNPGKMDELPSEVMVTTKFDKRRTIDENIDIIPQNSQGNKQSIDLNNVLYSQPSLKKKPTRSYSNLNKEDRSPSEIKSNTSPNDITKMLLTMGKNIIIQGIASRV